VFGVPLDDYLIQVKRKVPPLLHKAIAYLNDTFKSESETCKNNERHVDSWIVSHIHPQVYQLRKSLDTGKISRKGLRKYPPETIIACMKLYLLELPISVCRYAFTFNFQVMIFMMH
jgi:hypothetical protein